MANVEGFILAGGASSRMGRDKAKLRLGDKTFVERAAMALSAIANDKTSIIGNSFGASVRAKLPDSLQIQTIHELPVLPDVYSSEPNQPQKRGALIGLHAALFYARADWLAVLACDLPFASRALFERLNEFRGAEFDAIAPLQPDGKPQPLCALYRRAACLPRVEKMLAENDWSVRGLLSQVKTRRVEFSEFDDLPNADFLFFNVNTPADYELARSPANKI